MSTIDKDIAEKQIKENLKQEGKLKGRPTGYVIVKYFNIIQQAYNPKNPESWWNYAIFVGPHAKSDYEDFMNPFVTTTVGEVQLLWGSKRFYSDEEKREPENRLTKPKDEFAELLKETNAKMERMREGKRNYHPGRRR